MVAETVVYSDIANRSVGLGIAVVVTGLLAGIIIQFTRRIRQMPAYFVSNFEFFRDKNPKLPVVAAVLYYILLATPIVLLIVWVIVLGVNVGSNPALPVLFIGIFIGLIFVPSQSRLFYFKVLAMFIAYITAEMLTLGLIFDQLSQTSFWTLTALSLTLNGLFVIVTMWFMDDQIWTIPTDVPSAIKQKIRAQVKIWKQPESPPQIIDGAIHGKVANLSKGIRYVVIVITYILALVVLAIYSVIGKYKTIYNFQALVNSVAITTTDIIVFMLLLISKKSGFDPNFNAVIVVAVRVCIIAFSGVYWFFGYCLLYLILMTYTSLLIVNKYYPTYEKPPVFQVVRINILKMPEAAALVLLLAFSALVYFMGVDSGKNVPITQATIGEGVYPFWAVGVSTILLSFSIFFYLITARIVDRGRLKVRTISMYYIGCEGCSEYYVFLGASYAFLVVLGFHLFSVVGRNLIWASCVFLPFFYQSFVVFYSNWVENDYLLLGDVNQFNKKIKKIKEKEQKIRKMRNSVIVKMKQQAPNQENIALDEANVRVMDNAKVQENWIVDNYDVHSSYSQWRDDPSIIQAIKSGKLLPTDKKILISLPVMVLILLAYSLTFFFTENRDMSAFTVSVQIIVLFCFLIPARRYFFTFHTPNVGQIVLFVLGLLFNYGFGIASYAAGWNTSPAYTVLWTVVNPLIVLIYAAVSLLRDKGLVIPTFVFCAVSMLFSFGPGIILLAWFKSIPVGVVLIGVGFYYSYFLATVIIYKKMNNSVPFALYPITIVMIVITCFAVMVYAFISADFDDFYGFSVTYLAINLLILFYAGYRVVSDILSRADKPNFYSPYGIPIYKYDFNIKSAVENDLPLKLWLLSWFMFYVYTVLMQIFIVDTNYGTSASMIPLTVFSISFFYVVTHNGNRAGRIKDDITQQIIQTSWDDVVKTRDKQLLNFLDLDQLQKELADAIQRAESGQTTMKVNQVKINPQQNIKTKADKQQQLNQTTTKIDPKKDGVQEERDIAYVIYELQTKIEKATENDKILLVNFWTQIIFKTESKRKKTMLQFINFIKDCSDILSGAGIALVLNDNLYDLELIYNQAFQQMHTLSPIQRVFFNKQLKLYLQRKQKESKEKQDVNKKQNEAEIKRQQQLQNKILKDDDNKNEDPNLPIEKMKDGPAKLKKLKQTTTAEFNDTAFKPVIDIIPTQVRSQVRGWKRPSKDSVVMKNAINSGMEVRQGMIGDCYLISAIGVLGKDRIRGLITDPSQCPPGCYMVKFNKLGKDLYVIIDDVFPVVYPNADNDWLFGRCEDSKELFCNIIEKAYAKLYGSYTNIVGGKVALALSDMTGGFPEQIELKPYQQANTNEIFDKMVKFMEAGYLMGAGSPPNAKGDAVEIDGIYQGHAYLVLDVKNLDGNRLIKLRNPHGNQSKESTLDWSDDSPKWNNRLKGLLGETMAADGAFWIGLDDFVYCFRAVYVCRIFDNSWKRVGPFQGQWKGKSAAGLKGNKGSPVLSNNPHYGIKVSKACTVFIELRQNQVKDSSGKNQIFFMVQKNDGKRIDAPATNKLAGMSGPAINSRSISKQISLTADSFPYTFSLMAAAYQQGAEGTFSISMFCNDSSIEVIDDSVFGR